MYSYADHFLTDTAVATVGREDNGDVFIRIADDGFRIVWFGTYAEAQKFLGDFATYDYHHAWNFPGGVTVFDKLEYKTLTNLKFTLEMM